MLNICKKKFHYGDLISYEYDTSDIGIVISKETEVTQSGDDFNYKVFWFSTTECTWTSEPYLNKLKRQR